MLRRLDISHRDLCMDLAERVEWPRAPEKWELLFATGPGYGMFHEEAALSAMVVLPRFAGATVVAMMVVDPSQQGRGLGRKLLEAALEDAAPPLLLYATKAGEPLYRRLGFENVDRVRRCIGLPRSVAARSPVRAASQNDRRTIVAADAAAFGADRSYLIERLLDRAESAVIDNSGGFAIRWFNGSTDVVGPVVAADEASAIALVDAALEGCTRNARLDACAGSSKLIEHAHRIGLADDGDAPLMTRPAGYLPGERSRYHAIMLQAFG